MELEKIVSTILEKVGNTDVSPQTVRTLISLKPVADGSEPDDEYFDSIANVVKSVQGNVNNVFTAKLKEQVDAKVEAYKLKHPKQEPRDPVVGGSDDRLKKLEDELKELRAEQDKEKKERARKDLLASVKKGLEDKSKESNTKLNNFFVKTALAKLNISDKDADVKSLIAEAEKLYNADVKEAGYEPDTPHAGGGKDGSQERIDEHEWDDVSKIVGRNRPKSAES